MANSYLEGQRIKCECWIREEGVLVDPTIVYFRTLDPDHNVTTHAYGAAPNDVTRVGAGHYRYDLMLDDDGTWWYRWESAGTHEGAMEARVEVADPAWPLW